MKPALILLLAFVVSLAAVTAAIVALRRSYREAPVRCQVYDGTLVSHQIVNAMTGTLNCIYTPVERSKR